MTQEDVHVIVLSVVLALPWIVWLLLAFSELVGNLASSAVESARRGIKEFVESVPTPRTAEPETLKGDESLIDSLEKWHEYHNLGCYDGQCNHKTVVAYFGETTPLCSLVDLHTRRNKFDHLKQWLSDVEQMVETSKKTLEREKRHGIRVPGKGR